MINQTYIYINDRCLRSLSFNQIFQTLQNLSQSVCLWLVIVCRHQSPKNLTNNGAEYQRRSTLIEWLWMRRINPFGGNHIL